jgi:hypothetical protein
MKATSRRSFENLSSLFLAMFLFLQGLGAASAQPRDARMPGLSNAPAVGFSNARLGPFFHFYHFTPIADAQGGFPFQNILGPPSINSDGVIAYHAILTGGVEGIFTSKVQGNINTMAATGSDPYNFGFDFAPSINDTGQVSFIGSNQTPSGITNTPLRAQVGTQLTALVDYPFHLTDYCQTQINSRGEVVTLATREDGGHAVVVQGPPPLVSVTRAVAVDKPNTDMDQALVVGSLNCAPSINSVGMVAFTGVKTDGNAGVFTGDSEGNFTQIVGVDDVFAGFGNVALNETGGINKVGMVLFQAKLQNGSEGLFRWSPTGLTKITDVIGMGAVGLGGFAMDFRGQVAFELIFDPFWAASAVFREPGGLFGRLIGPGDVLFGRTVLSAHIGRDSLNLNDQLAVWLIFSDGAAMIARGDPVNLPFGIFGNPVAVLQTTTGSGSSVSVGTPVTMLPAYHTLSFDLTFLSEGGTLDVKLGDAVTKSIPATEIGVRHRISIPIDLRNAAKDKSAPAARPGSTSQLQFVLSGKAGLSAQLGDVQIPGVFSDNFQSGSLVRWHIDRTGGGSASLANASRFPLKIRVEAEKRAQTSGAQVVNVTMSSEGGLDVTTDIERPTLRLAGAPPRTRRDAAGHEVPDCEIPKSSRDRTGELMCQFEVGSLSADNHDPTFTLEAATRFGWGVTGSAKVHLP